MLFVHRSGEYSNTQMSHIVAHTVVFGTHRHLHLVKSEINTISRIHSSRTGYIGQWLLSRRNVKAGYVDGMCPRNLNGVASYDIRIYLRRKVLIIFFEPSSCRFHIQDLETGQHPSIFVENISVT